MPPRIAAVPLRLRDLGRPRRVTAVPLFDDWLSTLTNQPASLDDEFGYGFEHARLRTRNSRYSVSGGQSRRCKPMTARNRLLCPSPRGRPNELTGVDTQIGALEDRLGTIAQRQAGY